MTDLFDVTSLAAMVNVAEVLPDATDTVAGTVAASVFELESATTCPPDGAAEVSRTVPLAFTPPETVVGETLTAESGPADAGSTGSSEQIRARTTTRRFIEAHPSQACL